MKVLPPKGTREFPSEIPEKVLTRLLEKTTFEGDCWLFSSVNKKGYSYIEYNGKNYGIHRLVAHFCYGLDLDNSKEHATHKIECPNKNCWNPIHIEVADNQKNMLDNVALGVWRNQYGGTDKPYCINGHEMIGGNRLETEGRVKCRECQRRAAREYMQRRRHPHTPPSTEPPTNKTGD